MKKVFSLLAVSAAFAIAQDSPTSTLVAPLGIPCEPGQELPLGPGFPVVCPAAEEQGFLVFVKTTNADTGGFKLTLRYKNNDGEAKTAEQTVARNKENDWTTVVFQVGRMKTEALPGNTVDGVDVEETAAPPTTEPPTEPPTEGGNKAPANN